MINSETATIAVAASRPIGSGKFGMTIFFFIGGEKKCLS
nr:MAG: hypothetical protein [Helarchaeota virus Nidhogg Meg22_1012]